ncbi:MAG: carbonic anhydrase [Candidatus Promineifilaceae bacterium]
MDRLLDNSSSARRKFFSNNHRLIQHLAQKGQNPTALFIGCADSRVVPEQLLGARPGDFFMLRNIANVIPPYKKGDLGVASVLEFAVLTLEVPHIIVCGHTDCGGIKGLDDKPDASLQPALANWLKLAAPAQEDVDKSGGRKETAERHQAIVERNVVLQLDNLKSYPFIQKRIDAGNLSLHGWVYYLERPEIRYYDTERNRFI